MKAPIANIILGALLASSGFLVSARSQVAEDGKNISPSPSPYVVKSELSPLPKGATQDDKVLDYEQLLSARGKEYQEFLGKETDRHQEFLHDLFTILAWALGIIAGIFGLALIFLNKKSKDEIKEEIDKQFQSRVQAQVDAKLSEFKRNLAGQEEKVSEEAKTLSQKFQALKIDTSAETERMVENASVIAFAALVIGLDEEKDPPELRIQTREDTVARLLKIQAKVPTHRTLAIFIGRLYRQLGRTGDAIEALDRTLAARAEASPVWATDTDQAALLYNKSCYQWQLAEAQSGPEREKAADEAWATIRRSIELDPSNLEFAKQDPDLRALGESEKRKWAEIDPQKNNAPTNSR